MHTMPPPPSMAPPQTGELPAPHTMAMDPSMGPPHPGMMSYSSMADGPSMGPPHIGLMPHSGMAHPQTGELPAPHTMAMDHSMGPPHPGFMPHSGMAPPQTGELPAPHTMAMDPSMGPPHPGFMPAPHTMAMDPSMRPPHPGLKKKGTASFGDNDDPDEEQPHNEPRTMPPHFMPPPPNMGHSFHNGAPHTSGPHNMGPPHAMAGAKPPYGDPPSSSRRTDTDGFSKWDNVRSFVAYMFTLSCFAVFTAPMVVCIQMANDHDVAFWIGRWGNIAIFVPIFLIGQHFYHLWMLQKESRRKRYIFIVVPVVPAVFFMIISGTYASFGRYLYGHLKSSDCLIDSSHRTKYLLQQAYEEAYDAKQQCLARLQQENFGLPLRRSPVLQSCPEWDALVSTARPPTPWKGHSIRPGYVKHEMLNNMPRWQYLADVEANHLCGGFCTNGPSLWVSYAATGLQGGSCSKFVAFRFLSVVQASSFVFTLNVLILLIVIPCYVMSRSFLSNLGYKSQISLA